MTTFDRLLVDLLDIRAERPRTSPPTYYNYLRAQIRGKIGLGKLPEITSFIVSSPVP
jgi:hypothetical protein